MPRPPDERNEPLRLPAQGAPRVKIATYNVNGVKGRLPMLLRWLEETAPDIA